MRNKKGWDPFAVSLAGFSCLCPLSFSFFLHLDDFAILLDLPDHSEREDEPIRRGVRTS